MALTHFHEDSALALVVAGADVYTTEESADFFCKGTKQNVYARELAK